MNLKQTLAHLEKRVETMEKELQLLKNEIANLKQVETEENLPNEPLLEKWVDDGKKRRIVKEAIRKGLLRWSEHGRLTGNMGSKVLVAYFIGRLWANDEVRPCPITHEPTWKFGGMFPNKLVENLFEEKGLRDLRKSRNGTNVPIHHEIIDDLLDNN